ncbi:nucleotidyltransferase domain-containing protein [bacterium]|nr:nucleotidyltransferase domain-containing protein [bacterium]
MDRKIQKILDEYVSVVKSIYKEHIQKIILYGSYARGDYREDSDIDIMILLDIPDTKIKEYRHTLSNHTYDFNMDNDVDIKPIVKNEEHFNKWSVNYPFYSNVKNEGVSLYGTIQ